VPGRVNDIGQDDELATTAPANHADSNLPVTARVVDENEEDYEHLQQQLRQKDNQLQRQG
jgi:hypothetical protein